VDVFFTNKFNTLGRNRDLFRLFGANLAKNSLKFSFLHGTNRPSRRYPPVQTCV
jgi:hypothetical protein